MRLYYSYKGGMAPGHLPFAGGLADQSAWVMACFDHCAHIEAEHRKATEGDAGPGAEG